MLNKLLILFLFFNSGVSLSKVSFQKWNQNSSFNEKGQVVKLDIQAKISELNRNEYHDSFSIPFPQDQEIYILESGLKDRGFQTDFDGSRLTFFFNQAFNNEVLDFQIQYLIASSDSGDDGYTRYEWIQVPPYAASSQCQLFVTLPSHLMAYDYGVRLTPRGKSYLTWSGRVPAGGLAEPLRLTPRSATFQVTNSVSVHSQDKLNFLLVSAPAYFEDSPDKVLNSKVSTNPEQAKITRHSGKIFAEFSELENFNAVVRVDTRVKVLADSSFPDNFGSGKETTRLSSQDRQVMKNVVGRIKKDLGLTRAPSYGEVVRWVNGYITYDISYVGKEMSLRQIVDARRGVCLHFATLCVGIMKYLDVPAILAFGMAWDSNLGEFSQHAWAAIRPAKRWISVDPTWNIYSGYLPVSHIYLGTETSALSEFSSSSAKKPVVAMEIETTAREI